MKLAVGQIWCKPLDRSYAVLIISQKNKRKKTWWVYKPHNASFTWLYEHWLEFSYDFLVDD